MTIHCTIELHVRETGHLFDPLDASPLVERDLSHRVEEFIVESMKELDSKNPCEVVLHVDQPTGLPDEEQVVVRAIRGYFQRQSKLLQSNLRRLLRRGFVSLLIGLTFLGLFFLGGQILVHWMGQHAVSTVMRESLIIGGWVAMWRPLEIFLYDWWPILAERRLYDKISRLHVRVVSETQ